MAFQSAPGWSVTDDDRVATVIRLEDELTEPVAVVTGTWDDADEERWIAWGRPELSLRSALVPISSPLDFLKNLDGLTRLSLVGRMPDDAVVSDLVGLEYLNLDTTAEHPVDLRRLDRLTDLGLSYDRIPVDLLPTSLRRLYWSYTPLTSLDPLSRFPHLTSVELDSPTRLSAIVSDPAAEQAPLERIQIGESSRPLSLTGIHRLAGTLRTLDLIGVRLQVDGLIDELLSLRQLVGFSYVGSTSFTDVAWVSQLPELQRFALAGKARIEDGDLRPLVEHPALDYVYVQPRRHNSHRLADYIDGDGSHVRDRR